MLRARAVVVEGEGRLVEDRTNPLPPAGPSGSPRRSNLQPGDQLAPGRFGAMFGPGFEGCWYAVPGVPGLELSGDLRLRGPGGVRRMRHDRNGRPYVQARRNTTRHGAEPLRERRVLLHRAVMSVLLGRELAPGEMVCHRDDDKRNNWPANLYLGDARSNAADSVRNGRRPTGERHPAAKLSDEEVRQVRLALYRGDRGRDLARVYGVHKSTISRIKHGVRRRAC